MSRYARFLLIVILFLVRFSEGVYSAERVTVYLKDGTKLTGVFVEFSRERKYVIICNGTRQEIEESWVRSIEVIGGEGERGVGITSEIPWVGGEAEAVDIEEPSLGSFTMSACKEAADAYAAGVEAEARHEYDRAIEQYSLAKKADTWFAAARFNLARVLIKTGRFAEGEQEIEDILRIDPHSIPVLELKCYLYKRSGQNDLRLAAQEQLLAARFTGPEFLYRKSHLWLKAGYMTKARSAWAEYLAADPSRSGMFDVEARLIREGKRHREKGDFDMALTKFFDAARMNSLLQQEVNALIVETREAKLADLRTKRDLPMLAHEINALIELNPGGKEGYQAVLKTELESHVRLSVELLDASKLKMVLSVCKEQVDVETARWLWSEACRMVATAFKAADSSAKARYPGLLDVLRQSRPDNVEAADDSLRALASCYKQIADKLAAGQLYPDARQAYEHAMLLDNESRPALTAAVAATYFAQADEFASRQLYPDARAAYEHAMSLGTELRPAQKESYRAMLKTELESRIRRHVERLDASKLEMVLSVCKERMDAETGRWLWREACRMVVTAFEAADSSAKAGYLELLDALRKSRPDNVKTADDSLCALASCYKQIADELAAGQLYSDARQAYERAMLLDDESRPALVAAIAAMYLAEGESLLAEDRPEAALEVLTIAREKLPTEPKISDAIEEAEFRIALKFADGVRPLAERIQVLQTFLLKPRSDERRAKSEEKLARLQAMFKEMKARAIRDLNRYNPLSVGSEFKYRRGTGAFETRTVLSVVESQEALTAEIEVTSIVAGMPISFRHTMTQTESELVIQRNGQRDSLLKFPISVGLSWEWREGRVNVRRRYVADDVTVVTPAGEFKNCLKVEMLTYVASEMESDLPVEVISYHYFAPGVGLVKVEFLNPMLADLNMELVSYSMK